MAVPCRNRRLFRRIFRSHRGVQSAVSLNFREGRRSYALRKLIRYSCIYEACMSPALNGSSAIRRFERSVAIEIRDGITFDFYTGLPHIVVVFHCSACLTSAICCTWTIAPVSLPGSPYPFFVLWLWVLGLILHRKALNFNNQL